MDDSEAALLLLEGSQSGLKHFVEKYQTKAVRAAILITRDRMMAEDIAQSAFLRIAERINQYDRSRPFEPWFLRIVTNIALKRVSRGAQPISIDAARGSPDGRWLLEKLEDSSPDPETQLELKDLELRVKQALDRLSPSQRQVVVFRYYLGLKATEMAEVMQRQPGTIRWHLHQARERLRSLLQIDNVRTDEDG